MIFTTKKVWLRVSVLLSIVIGSLSAAVYVNGIYQNHMLDFPFDSSTLDVYTANGRKYIHQKDVKLRENGHRVWNNVCLKELKNEWPKRSSVGIFEENKNGYKIRFTLTHYLTSKGLKKDSIGVHALSDEDIKHIENGHTNYKFVTDWGVSRRIDDLFTEIENYHTGGNPNNSSLIQRLTYFKVGLKLFKENVVFGIGSGDVRNAFDSYYAQNDHGLVDKRKGIAHNQYMNIAIGMGVIGLVWFILAFFYPLRFYWKDYLFTCFIIMIAISFLSDNTLDSQAGATLFAFFNSFLMIRKEMETADALI